MSARPATAPRRPAPSGDGKLPLVTLLAVPTLGFALALTLVTTYLPVAVAGATRSATAIAALIAVEGLMAMTLPLVVGARSDRLQTRLGGRLPFFLAGVPVVTLTLVMLGFVDGFAGALVIVTVLFAGYYVAYEPYRALYPDLLEDGAEGRAQSAQAVARGIGTALALVGGGLLLTLGRPVPFVVAAGVLLLTSGVFARALMRRRELLLERPPGQESARRAIGELRRLVRRRPGLWDFFVANALWEAALGAIRTFVVLWVTIGVGLGLAATSGIIGAAGVVVLVGAALAGRLAERFGTRRVLQVSAVIYGAPMVVPFLTESPWLLVPFIPVISGSAGVLMALPYALLIPMMPRADHGLLTGFYSLSRGVGIVLGPVLAGGAIEATRALGAPLGTDGYSTMWLVAGLLVLASVPFVRRMRAHEPAVARRSRSTMGP